MSDDAHETAAGTKQESGAWAYRMTDIDPSRPTPGTAVLVFGICPVDG